MDYGEGIRMLERAGEKFEFPANWGIDLQMERLTNGCKSASVRRYWPNLGHSLVPDQLSV
jgi:hypothetical protein